MAAIAGPIALAVRAAAWAADSIDRTLSAAFSAAGMISSGTSFSVTCRNYRQSVPQARLLRRAGNGSFWACDFGHAVRGRPGNGVRPARGDPADPHGAGRTARRPAARLIRSKPARIEGLRVW